MNPFKFGNPMTDGMDVSFVPSAEKSSAMLEDSLELLEKISSTEKRLIVVMISIPMLKVACPRCLPCKKPLSLRKY